MKLYHGTTARVGKQAVKHGLKPRSLTGKSNWKHSVESHADMIYLTTVYAPYFALMTGKTHRLFSIIEVETDLLDESLLHPDEDFIEQATRTNENLADVIKGHDMKARTESVRDNLELFQRYWRTSVGKMGTCGYMGTIPPSAITKVVVGDIAKCASICSFAVQASITVQNYTFLRESYGTITKWFLKEPVDFDTWLEKVIHIPKEAHGMFKDYIDEQRKVLTKKLADQSGLTIIHPK